jgi:hypothetical protein
MLPGLSYVKLGAIAAASAALFAGGWKVEGWRATDALDTEKAAHARDVKALQDDWQAKLNAAQALLTQAIAERDAQRQANATAREDAANAYTKQIAQLKAAAGAADARAQRVRDELAAAIAAAGPAGGNGAMPQTGPGPAACSGGGAEACRLLGRAIDLARRCTEAAAEQHSALAEAVASWPR